MKLVLKDRFDPEFSEEHQLADTLEKSKKIAKQIMSEYCCDELKEKVIFGKNYRDNTIVYIKSGFDGSKLGLFGIILED